MSASPRRNLLSTLCTLLAVAGLFLSPGCVSQLPDVDGNEVTLTAENFDVQVLQSDLPVLVDFWASWCGPCLQLEPVVAHLSLNYEGQLKVGKVNIDQEPALTSRFGVSSIPMLALFHNGELVATQSGYVDLDTLTAWVEGNVPSITADSGT